MCKVTANNGRSILPSDKLKAPASSMMTQADRARRRKSVTFAPEATEYLISTKLSPQEHDAVWYHPRAFAEFKKRNRILGKTIRQRRSLFDEYTAVTRLDPLNAVDFESDMDPDVTRGIEHFCCAEYFEERKKNKQATVQAVISEQRKQRFTGMNDDEAIAAVARSFTKEQRANALRFGRRDEADLSDGVKEEYLKKCADKCRSIERPMSPSSVARFNDAVEVEDPETASTSAKNFSSYGFSFTSSPSLCSFTNFFR